VGIPLKRAVLNAKIVRSSAIDSNTIVSKHTVADGDILTVVDEHPTMVHTVIANIAMKKGDVSGRGEEACATVGMKIRETHQYC